MKIKQMSFKKKLWIYFTIFTAFIFSILWLLQTVFLQSFYNGMLVRNTRAVAEKIEEKASDEQIERTIDRLARENSVLVFVTDAEGNLLYGSDEYKEIQNNQNRIKPGESIKKKDSSDVKKHGNRTELPMNFDDIFDKLKADPDGTAELDVEGLFACGRYIDYYGQQDKAVLYVSTTKDAVGSSVRIIRIQLIWVTVISLILGFIFSWLLARKFSNPVDRLSDKAKKLGTEGYENGFGNGFCTELDGLSRSLDETNIKLNRSREFQMELLANVSHDLRTPLTMIKGYAEMIRDISWDNDEDRESDVQVIIKEADRLTALVNEILEYSELQSMTGEEKSEFYEVNLSSLVKSVTERFEKLSRPENVTIETDISDNICIMADESRIERALYNLMDNAVRHTGSGKKIRVTLSDSDKKAVIKVTDFGTGIPEEEIEAVWDRYYTSRQRKGKGVSGLGLAIVKQIVSIHSGSCRVENSEGEGCTFIMEFPEL